MAGGVVPPTKLAALNNIGSDMRIIKANIKWSLRVTGEANPVVIGESSTHVIYVTYGVPKIPSEGLQADAAIPTPARMDRAIAVFAKAFKNSKKETKLEEPKPQRIVYEAVQLHIFNGAVFLLEKSNVYAWKVYDVWTIAENPGADCISGAAFIAYAALVVGMPGSIDAKRYTVKSETDLKTAVDYRSMADEDKNRFRNNKKEVLALSFSRGYNAFEGTVAYSNEKKTFFFPVGDKMLISVDSKDKVLRVATQAAWFTNTPGKYKLLKGIEPKYEELLQGDFYSVD
jgi:hypothetical protein